MAWNLKTYLAKIGHLQFPARRMELSCLVLFWAASAEAASHHPALAFPFFRHAEPRGEPTVSCCTFPATLSKMVNRLSRKHVSKEKCVNVFQIISYNAVFRYLHALTAGGVCNSSGHFLLTPQRLRRFAGIFAVRSVGLPQAAPRTAQQREGHRRWRGVLSSCLIS